MNKLEHELLIRYLEGTLPETEAQIVEAQLAASAPLREELESLKQMQSMFEAQQFDFGKDFTQKVMQAYEQEQQQASGLLINLHRPFRFVAAAGVAAVFALLFTIYFTQGTINQDALLGSQQLNDNNMSALLLNEYDSLAE